MPLIKSSSKKAFESNLKAELAAGKDKKQALAIAYATQRRARKLYEQILDAYIFEFLPGTSSMPQYNSPGVRIDPDDIGTFSGAAAAKPAVAPKPAPAPKMPGNIKPASPVMRMYEIALRELI